MIRLAYMEPLGGRAATRFYGAGNYATGVSGGQLITFLPVPMCRFEPYILDWQCVFVVNIEFSAAQGLADSDSVCRLTTGSGKSEDFTECLKQDRTNCVALMPIVGQEFLARKEVLSKFSAWKNDSS